MMNGMSGMIWEAGLLWLLLILGGARQLPAI
jgi:hypothetical protein